MTTAIKITEELLDFYSKMAPENAKVLLLHEDGRIFPAVEYKRGSGFWYPDGRVSSLKGIFDDVELVAERREGKFVKAENLQQMMSEPPKLSPRATRMQKHQQALAKAMKPVNAEPDVKQMQKEAVSLQDLPDLPENDFVSITSLQSEVHKRTGELFISLRQAGQIVFTRAMVEFIGDKNFDIQVSAGKREVRLYVNRGELKMPKSHKLSCIGLMRMICEVRGIKEDAMKVSLGRINLTKTEGHNYLSGSF